MKILFTGMASHHCQDSDETTFISGLSKLASNFAQVEWRTPRVDWSEKDLNDFDLVFVGVCPPTALSANKAYGALNVINLLWGSDKLRLVADYPQIWQYKNSINQAANNPAKGLFSDMYKKRKDFTAAMEQPSSVVSAVEKLATMEWPKTIYPSLPWQSSDKIATSMGLPVKNSLVGMNLDTLYINESESYTVFEDPRSHTWLVQGDKNSWAKVVIDGVKGGHLDLRKTAGRDEQKADYLMKTSIGFVLPPEERKSGIWWNKRIRHALQSRTPIVTDWRETKNFDWSWAKLAYQVEDMTLADRNSLSSWQLKSYMESISDIDSLNLELSDILFKSNVGELHNA